MSKFLLKDATIADVHAIASDLSDISRDELVRQVGPRWWSALQLAKSYLDAGPAVVLLEADKPIAVFGHMPHHVLTLSRVTWFLATKRYFALGPRGVIYARRYLEQLRRHYPGLWFYTYSGSEHPDADRWFTLLGYQRSNEQAPDYVLYVLPPIDQQDKAAAPC